MNCVMQGIRFTLILMLISAPVQARNLVAESYAYYMNLISKGQTVQDRDFFGVEFDTHKIYYDGSAVTFQYQLWKVRKDSICAQVRDDLPEYFKCTQAAKSLFRQTCKSLRKKRADDWKHQRLEELYCGAATDFDPVRANLEQANNVVDYKDLKRRQLCAVLRVKAMTLQDDKSAKVRDAVCDNGEIDLSNFSISDFLGGGEKMNLNLTW